MPNSVKCECGCSIEHPKFRKSERITIGEIVRTPNDLKYSKKIFKGELTFYFDSLSIPYIRTIVREIICPICKSMVQDEIIKSDVSETRHLNFELNQIDFKILNKTYKIFNKSELIKS